jgi:hypothetical protein
MLLTDIRQRVCLSHAILFCRCVPVGHRGIYRDERWEQREYRRNAEATRGRSERPERLGSSACFVVRPHRQRGGHATRARTPWIEGYESLQRRTLEGGGSELTA